MLQITIANDLLPPKGKMTDCSGLGKRVKSASCADGCVTAASAANRQAKSRGRIIPLRCNPSFPTRFPRKAGTRADSPILRRSPTRLNYQSLSRSPRLAVEKSRRNKGVTVTAVAAVAGGEAASQCPGSLLRFPGQVVPPAKLPRPKFPAKRPNRPRLRRHDLPKSRRVQSSSR